MHIFEIGQGLSAELPGSCLRSGPALAILIHGAWEGDAWLQSNVTVDYYLVKGLVERLCGALGATLDYAAAEEPFLHPGKSAVVRDARGRPAGWLGEVHPLVLQSYDLRAPAVAAELDAGCSARRRREMATFRDLLAYPVVEQDLALVVDSAVPAAQVVDCLRSAGGDLLENVAVFDLYEGAQVGAGKKSLALRLSFRAADRTLSEAEVNELRARIVKQLKQAVGGELRA